MQSLADVLAPALVGRDDPPRDPAVLGSTVFSIARLPDDYAYELGSALMEPLASFIRMHTRKMQRN